MLGHFPPPHPGEWFYSVCSRYKERMGKSDFGVCNDFFGRPIKGLGVDFPRGVDYLSAQLPAAFSTTAAELIWGTSTFPFFAPFLPKSTAQEYIENLQPPSGRYLIGPSGSPMFLRYCPECANRDRAKYHEAYWHRSHQLRSTLLCPEHHIPIVDTLTRRRSDSLALVTAEVAIEKNSKVIRQKRPSSDFSVLAWLAEQTECLLKRRELFEIADLSKAYLYHLHSRGLASATGKVKQRELYLAVSKRFSNPLLAELRCELDLNSEYEWPVRVVKGFHVHPIQHLLLICVLGMDVDTFFGSVGNCSFFEEGPVALSQSRLRAFQR